MKTARNRLVVAAVIGLGGWAAQAAAACAPNPVANCGFEVLPEFAGWTLAGNDVTAGLIDNLYGVEAQDPYPLASGGTAPHGGSSQAFFADTTSNPTTLAQTLATTPGLYSVSFFLAQQLLGPGVANNSLVVSFGGNTLATLSNVGVQNYTQYSFTTSVAASSAVLSFTFGNDVGEFLLDDVSVAAVVPEPAPKALMSVGMLALAGICRRRRTAA